MNAETAVRQEVWMKMVKELGDELEREREARIAAEKALSEYKIARVETKMKSITDQMDQPDHAWSFDVVRNNGLITNIVMRPGA